MRHRHGLRKLNRTSSHRLAMLRNLSVSLIEHEVIRTTLPKAKELRRVVEPLITRGKRATLANRRLAFARLRHREAMSKLFNVLGPRYQNRPGGYLRILKCGFRAGDHAPMARVDLMDRPEVEVKPEDQHLSHPGAREAALCSVQAGRSSPVCLRDHRVRLLPYRTWAYAGRVRCGAALAARARLSRPLRAQYYRYR